MHDVDDHGDARNDGERLARQAGGCHAGRDDDDGVQLSNSVCCVMFAKAVVQLRYAATVTQTPNGTE